MNVTPKENVEGVPLRIGEVAHLTGLTTRTLRYWEEVGLVAPNDRLCSGERLYSPAEVERVTHVRELQELLGLSLAEIRVVLDSEDAVERARSARRAGASTPRRLALLDQAIEANAHLIERMNDRLTRIATFRDECVERSERMRERSIELRSDDKVLR